jgi:hypothetical protein
MMQSDWKKKYSEFVHSTAVSWGFEEIPGRPLIRPYDDVYIKQPIPLLDEANYRNNAHIGIFQLNDLWGCEVSIRLPSGQGTGYKAFLGFCKPHPTRQGAIKYAVDEILSYIHRDVCMTEDDQRCVRQIDKWCKELSPQQMRMEI